MVLSLLVVGVVLALCMRTDPGDDGGEWSGELNRPQ